MRFFDQKYYMHKNCRDTAIFVVKNQHQSATKATLKVDLINLGYTGTPQVIMRQNAFVIREPEINNWIRIPSDKLYIPRIKDGLP